MTFLEHEIKKLEKEIFKIRDSVLFNDLVLRIFHLQAEYNPVYKKYIEGLGKKPKSIIGIDDIPFLPIELFKTHTVLTGFSKHEMIFESSGTTQAITSKHFVKSLDLYIKAYLEGFRHFFGEVEEYRIFGLLPSYLERSGSSLVHMVKGLMEETNCHESGFYLNNYSELESVLLENDKNGKKALLIGVSFALLELAKRGKIDLKNAIIMETGGMKGRGKELVRSELHGILKKTFCVDEICSEYGMTELLSQAYAKKAGVFECPPWMRVYIRELNDPFVNEQEGRTGGINIIDLANLHSCCFIETKDLGRVYGGGGFEVLGRVENSDIRGCNLMMFD